MSFILCTDFLAAVSLNIEVFFQQKELEKAKKQAKEAALLQQCKNSIGKSRNKTPSKWSWPNNGTEHRCSWQVTSDLAPCSTLEFRLKSRLLHLEALYSPSAVYKVQKFCNDIFKYKFPTHKQELSMSSQIDQQEY